MIHETIWLATLTEAERHELGGESGISPPRAPDVLVIGGGIVGLAIAYFLTKRRAGSVLVVEQGRLASGASAANAGGIFPGQQAADLPAAFRELGLVSTRLYTDLSQEPWAAFDWRQNGSVAVAPERFSCPMSEYVAQERARGRIVEHLAGGRLREIEPALDEQISEAVFYPQDGRLNPVRTALSFAREASRQGATIAAGVRVDGFEIQNGRVSRVRTSRGDVHPGHVVLATGWSAPQLAGQLGIRIPIEPAKGQMLATEPVSWRLRTNINSTLAVMQLSSGEVIAGGTVEYVGEDYASTPSAFHFIQNESRRVVPALRDIPFARCWAGLRPRTPDEMPIIDRVPGFDNLLIAAGHFKNGVLLAPVTGRLVAEWLVDGRPSMDLSPLRLTRFALPPSPFAATPPTAPE